VNPIAITVVALVAFERLAELWYAQRNTRALLEAGGVEVGRGHYPIMVALHAAWLLAILLAVPREAGLSAPLLIVFAILQGLRLWVLMSLGRYWTTRVITLPEAPLVRRGPYRYLRHPNYLVVAAEIAVLPLAFGAWGVAAVFSVLNAALLAWRISLEDHALAPRRQVLHTIP
jgi:methyltransferase